MARDSGEQYDRIQKALQAHILTDYPNPERRGCPSRDILNQLVDERGVALDTDSHYQHVIHCSPCYREFLGLIEVRGWERRARQPLQRFLKFLRRFF